LAGAAVSAVSAYMMTCRQQNYIHQMTDKNVKGEARAITYKITDRGWYTPILTGWVKRGIQLQRTDCVPNDS